MATLHTEDHGLPADLLWWGITGSEQVKWRENDRVEERVGTMDRGGGGLECREVPGSVPPLALCRTWPVYESYTLYKDTHTLNGSWHTLLYEPRYPSSSCRRLTPSPALLSEEWGRQGWRWGVREGGWANKGQEEEGTVDESSLQESPTSMAPSGLRKWKT